MTTTQEWITTTTMAVITVTMMMVLTTTLIHSTVLTTVELRGEGVQLRVAVFRVWD